MTDSTELWVNREDLRISRQVISTIPAIVEGQVLVAIDKFGLTANNVSYAVAGDSIGYWGYYPAEDGWGKIPVWGCASVIESSCAEVPVGDRLWGFFPMASHAVLQPGHVHADYFMDLADHRQGLPALYNQFRRTLAEPAFMQNLETERCLLFPLLCTSYLLYDYLIDNAFFGAQQVVIGSVSSKTGFGLAQMLHRDNTVSVSVIGLTSAKNQGFVSGLGCCDQIVLYGDEQLIDASLPTAYVDMSGDAELTIALHSHLGENMVESAMVGASHWENRGPVGDLPGARPTFFFAPGQIDKRNKEWGPGVAMDKAMVASAEVAARVKGNLQVEWIQGAEALSQVWIQLLDNKIPPSKGLMVSLN